MLSHPLNAPLKALLCADIFTGPACCLDAAHSSDRGQPRINQYPGLCAAHRKVAGAPENHLLATHLFIHPTSTVKPSHSWGRRTVSGIRQFLLLGARVSVYRAQESKHNPGETGIRAKCLPWDGAWGPGGPPGESRVDTRCVEWALKGARAEKGCAAAWDRVSPHREGLRRWRPSRARGLCAGPATARCVRGKEEATGQLV